MGAARNFRGIRIAKRLALPKKPRRSWWDPRLTALRCARQLAPLLLATSLALNVGGLAVFALRPALVPKAVRMALGVVTPEEVAEEARAAVAPLIGERHVETYTRYGGRWIQALAPPPPRTAPTPPTPAPRN